MSLEDERMNRLTGRIIGAAIEVHRVLGPGLRETIYERALSIEFDFRRIDYDRQVRVPMTYRGRTIGGYRLDFLVAGQVVVELKCALQLAPAIEAQVLGYLRRTRRKLGLILNFHSARLADGIKRLIL